MIKINKIKINSKTETNKHITNNNTYQKIKNTNNNKNKNNSENKKILLFIGKITISFLFITIFYYIFISQYTSPLYITEWISEYLEFKSQIAQNITEQKIIILSGSNALYGISAEKIEQSTGIKTVNFATCATLKGYIFERAKRILNENDIVILPLEYTYFFGNNEKVAFTTQSLEFQYLYRRDPNYYNNTSLIFKINGKLIGLKDLLYNIKYLNKEPNIGYHYQFMNKNGDFIANNITQNFTPIVINFPDNFNKIFNKIPFEPYTNKELEDFIDWSKKNNITILATYPSILCYDFYYESPYKESFTEIENYYKEKGLYTIGTPYDFCYYDINLFYNTDYHLNSKGKEIRTDFIINEVNKKLKNLIIN